MARQYESRSKGGIRLYGFDEFLDTLERMEAKGIEQAAEKCFDLCADVVVQSMNEKMTQAQVPSSLRDEARTFRVKNHGIYMFSYGWNKKDAETFRKVCYLNYGTPPRYTNKGAYRGRVEARGFITNAKRSAAQKMRKIQKDALKEMTKGQ